MVPDCVALWPGLCSNDAPSGAESYGSVAALAGAVEGTQSAAGEDKEVVFAQEHPPGWEGAFDFTPLLR